MKGDRVRQYIGTAVILTMFFVASPLPAQTTEGDLRREIEEKSAELQKIQAEREQVEKVLEETEQAKNTLSREIRVVDYQIQQLDLSVKANRLNLEKLALEIETASEDIPLIEESIKNKRETIGKLLIALQERDRQNLLVMMLRSENLAEGVAEVQSIMSLNFNLASSAEELGKLKEDMEIKLEEMRGFKNTREREQVTLANRQVIIQDQKQEKKVILAQTKNQESIYQQELDKLEKLQAEVSSEIENIESVLRQNVDPNLLPTPRPGVLQFPVPGGTVTQGYGKTPFVIANPRIYPGQHHNAIDIGKFMGAEIVAAEKGTVINVANQDAYCKGVAYGRLVVIRHENGLATLYAHMSKTIVSIGQKVERGELIGYMGNSGLAKGAHLHFTVFALQTLTPARPGFPEGTKLVGTGACGPMPVGADLNPLQYLDI